MHKKLPLLIISLLAVMLSACSFSLAEDIIPPPGAEQQIPTQVQGKTISAPIFPLMPPDPANGALIYADKCAACHGDTGMGDGPKSTEITNPVAAIGTPDLARRSTPAQWYTLLTQGNIERFMPPFPSLSDRQKWDVIAYVYTLSTSEEIVSQGEALYQEYCIRCHGVNGKGEGTDSAALAARPRDFSDQEWMAEKANTSLYAAITSGHASEMAAFSSQLSEAERWALAAYIRTFTFSLQNQAVVADTSTSPENTTEEQTEPRLTSGSVQIQISNSSGGEVPDNLPVTLYAFDEMQLTFTQTVSDGIDGIYTFYDIELLPNRVFMAGVDYQDQTYGSDIASVVSDTLSLTIPVSIFDSTTDTSKLTTDRLHLLLDFPTADTVQVVELHIISNPTNQTVVAAEEGGPVVSFSVPKGAFNLEFQDGTLGERYVPVDEGFADTQRVSPGTGAYQVVFAYQLPYDRKLDITKQIDLPTNAVIVLLPDNGVKIKSNELEDNGIQDMQGVTYHMYSGDSLAKGSQFVLQLSGRAKIGSSTMVTSPSSNSNLIIGLGTFGLALVIVGMWLYFRGKKETGQEYRARIEPVEAPAGQDSLPDDPDSLMDAIIALDDQYQADNIPEEAYLQRRQELKTHLKQLVDRSK